MSAEITMRAKEIIILQSERASLKTMADYVKEYILDYCDKDSEFVKQVNKPEKSFMGCIGYIKKKAMAWLKEQQNLEMENGNNLSGDVPNELCYQWAVEYYYTKPEPKPEPKPVETKTAKTTSKRSKKSEDKSTDNQLSLMETVETENSVDIEDTADKASYETPDDLEKISDDKDESLHYRCIN